MQEIRETDLLIVGGGTAGCLAAVEAKEKKPCLKVLIMEKAHIERSGCLAAGMNAINAYLNPGETADTFVQYVKKDACGLIREDLVKSMAEKLNEVVKKVEKWGLPIKKDSQGKYLPRGRWNIKINGESLKPIIAKAALDSGAEVLNRVAATNFLLDEKGKIAGVTGFGIRDGKFYIIKAKAVIIATGGAAGLYRPNNPGSAHHKMWYCPFNTGAGYAMGIRAGAEMTSLEMRFIALRTKDIISPTGTLALGFGAPQVNAKGEKFMSTRYADWGGERAPTPIRVYAPTKENKEGRGPCYMDTTHLYPEQVYDLKAAYLDMYPDIVLYWAANNIDPGKEKIEIQGTEPYITGGHCQSGYWINAQRATSLPGLYAAGDVAGGAPYKFVSGCWAEGVIAAQAAVEYIDSCSVLTTDFSEQIKQEKARVYAPYQRYQELGEGVTAQEMEERLQKIMDEYAGGVSTYYEMNEEKLLVAAKQLLKLEEQVQYLLANNWHELLQAHEVIDRLEIAQVLVQHLLYRQETRWPGYQTRLDYPLKDDEKWLKFVNSRKNPLNKQIEIIERRVKDECFC